MYAAQVHNSIEQAANLYSSLRMSRQAEKFRKVFFSIFDGITDISVETVGGTYTILADVPWAKHLLPLPALSGGTTRAASILLALTARENAVVLVDEIESGIFHARQAPFARALLEMIREYPSQLIMTTHSEEWLEKFLAEASDSTDDIAFWRMERVDNGLPTIRRFSAREFRRGLDMGEMR
jgi:AAA15 family ATPase/GTPase